MAAKLKYAFLAGLFLSALVLAFMCIQPAADFYAEKIYPVVSAVLSFVASPFHFSLQDAVVCAIVLLLVSLVILPASGKIRWRRSLGIVATLAVWMFVWVYSGWCLNYSRSSIYERLSATPSVYDSLAFALFLEDFTDKLNDSYIEDDEFDADAIEAEIKKFYMTVPDEYGLCRPKDYQHPKPMMTRRFQSGMGVLGYMGPLFCESHLNGDLLSRQYPFTLAHEMSHVLGVSSEAEANWWAWEACLSSEIPIVRYSAYYSLLPYVWSNASRLMSEEDFKLWKSAICPDVLNDLREDSEYWSARRISVIDDAQTYIYNIFLKANGVSSGVKNYSEVISLIISLDDSILRRDVSRCSAKVGCRNP